MLKFFRRLRLKLLEERTLKNYFLYAIGEILLVVIGILIALAINNLWQNRSDQTLSKVYLQSLKNDIQTDIQNLDKYKTRSIERIEKPLERAIDVFLKNEPTQVDTLKLLNDIQMAMYMNIVPLRKGTYEDLMSTGNLRLLKNVPIKNALHDYFEMANYYELYYTEMLGGKTYIREVLTKSYPFRYNHHDLNVLDRFKMEEKLVNVEELLKNTEVENIILLELVTTRWITRSFDNMLERAKEIEVLLNDELLKK